MKPVHVKIATKKIAGVQAITSNEQEKDYEGAKIPLLWREYFQNSILYPLSNVVEDAPAYAIYHNYKDGINGEYTITVGTEVTKDDNLEEGYKCLDLESGEYLRFEAKGEMPLAVITLWQDIWKYFVKESKLKRVFKTDFEVYTGDDEVSIYIGIENK